MSAAGPSQRAWEPTPLLTAPDTHPDANWAILRKSDNQPVHYFTRNTREEAQDTFMRVVGSAYHLYRLAPVTPRTRQQTEPAQSQGEFTGQWNVSIDGQVVTQVQAATQGEANGRAREWVTRQGSEFMSQHQGGEVTVTPVYA